MSRKESLLDLFVKTYLQTLEPISSKRLKDATNLNVSCATIRNYFQILSKEGMLNQAHSSSARLPTSKAFLHYWQKHLSFEVLNVDEKHLKSASENFGLFTLLKKPSLERLERVVECEKRFLILDFLAFSCVLNYSARMEKFLLELVGKSVEEVRLIATSVNALSLARQLEHLEYSNALISRFNLVGLKTLLHSPLFFEILEGKVLERLKMGLHLIEPSSMLVVRPIRLENICAQLLCFGKLECDYLNFFQTIFKEEK
ncbi:HrcA family transcriptional regulator [Helicobacter cetorum]|uniref:Heat-inducible transcription repressor n=1 Tax=Helicobacter cetorum (strain ATCC BAA-540 / CCUG 52418 / MIT 99-5656) TaxID=1163745 RepID=I0ERY3_HELCM|nr:HrcA family transcriptional regulator [Helicobacter cetorum]AFI05702.1 heat-inducible transcription repressor [Helicobacter cetorum MIT 99-5656]